MKTSPAPQRRRGKSITNYATQVKLGQPLVLGSFESPLSFASYAATVATCHGKQSPSAKYALPNARLRETPTSRPSGSWILSLVDNNPEGAL